MRTACGAQRCPAIGLGRSWCRPAAHLGVGGGRHPAPRFRPGSRRRSSPRSCSRRGSLPPHGDRKPLRCAADRCVRAPHYPSWGSETAGEPVVGRAHLGLITPHGDRKRPATGSTTSRPEPHYPSWGSETTDSVRQARFAGAHYPSWGSETSVWRQTRAWKLNSLPLMGIGNAPARQSSSDREALITPHGDRKPAGKASFTVAQRSHYPSWGSETARRMSRTNACSRLITPHGDRKPG